MEIFILEVQRYVQAYGVILPGHESFGDNVEEDVRDAERDDELPPFDPTEPDFLQAVYRVEKQLLIVDLKKESPIAYTGHSVVFKAYSQLYCQNVAVKIINKMHIPAVVADKFLARELEITSRAHHPHICACLSIFCVNANRIAIVTEFCSRGTLSHLVMQEKIIAGITNAARMFRQLIEAIQYLHERNVAHRDIKLENIFLDEKCDVKLADFGFARVINRAEKSTSFCGTKNYSSPSILRSKPYDHLPLIGSHREAESKHCWHSLPANVPSLSARYLIERLLTEDDLVRAGYEEILDSEWIRTHTNGKWIMADQHFVYEILDSPNS
uniref:Protein kinase domain-containing protein n=1 Tax=Ditylenchus dipsaci TaxID=166011 RepID=A0A915CVM5_9BILA